MTPLSDIHPFADLRPGRYLLDASGILYRGFNSVKPVAAVVILAPGEPTRRQLAELASDLARADDVRAVGDNPVDTSGETSSIEKMRADCAAEAAEREARFREATRLTVSHPNEVTARPPEPPLRSLARKEKPRAINGIAGTIDETEDDREFLRQLQAKVSAKQAARKKQAAPVGPKIDGKRVAAAYRAKASKPAPAPKVPTIRAHSPGECPNCGIPGFRGCEHFLPFEGDDR